MVLALTDHRSPQGALSAEGMRHLKILKNRVSQTAFHIFPTVEIYEIETVFPVGSGFEHNCRFFTNAGFSQPWLVDGFQTSNAGRARMRRVTWYLIDTWILARQ